MTNPILSAQPHFTLADMKEEIVQEKREKLEEIISRLETDKIKENYLWALKNNRNYFTVVLYEGNDESLQKSLADDKRISDKIKETLPDILVSFVDKDEISRGGGFGDYVIYPQIVSYVAMNGEGAKEIGKRLHNLETLPFQGLVNFLKKLRP